MSEKIGGAVDSSYDSSACYKPKASCNFFQEAMKALLKCLGADEPPSNTETPAAEPVAVKPPATSSETDPDLPQVRVVRPPITAPPIAGGS